jgi:hypothetical protein
VLLLNLHAHSLALDGVYVLEQGEPVFYALPAPDKYDIEDIAWNVCLGTQRVLRKLGKDWDLPADELDIEATTSPFLVDCAAASMSNTTLLGDRPGQAVLQLGLAVAEEKEESEDTRPDHGFDLHAGTRVPARDRKRLEGLCRYLLRPPISHDRLTLLDDGRVRVELKTAWRDGTRYLVFSPLDFIARLVPLVPAPRSHQIRFHGILAPNARLRSQVIPPRPQPLPEQLTLPFDAEEKPASHRHERASGLSKLQRISWAQLLERTMDFDMETCPECGATMKVVGFVLDPDEIALALDGHPGQAEAARTEHPPRGPPTPSQLWFDFAATKRALRPELTRLAP